MTNVKTKFLSLYASFHDLMSSADDVNLNDNRTKKRQAFARIPTWKILVIALLLALGLRLLLLGSKSLWLDEAWGLSVTKAGQKALWAGTYEDHHPPLFYLLSGYLIKLGESEFKLRLLSAIFGAASVLLIYQLGIDIGGKKVALSATWLSCLSPLLIWYSQEARSYSFLIFMGLVGTVALVKLFLRPNLGWWLLFVVAMSAALYTHYGAFLLIPVQLVLLAASLATKQSRITAVFFWLAGWAITIIAYWPWLHSPAARSFLGHLKTGSYPAQLFADKFNVDPSHIMKIFAAGLLVAIPIGLFLVYRLFQKNNNLWIRLRTQKWIQSFLVLLFIILLWASVIPRGYSIKKQLVIFWPFVLLFFSWFWPWEKSYQKLLASLLILSLLASFVNISLIPKAQWRETVSFIIKQSTKKDVVLLLPSYMTSPFDYYSQGRIARYGINPSSSLSELESLMNDYGRVWLVSPQVDIADPEKKIESWLKQHANRIEEKSFYRILIHLYQK